MKSESKKKDESKSPKPKKKSKRRYRNDRSKKWRQSTSEEDSSEENMSVSDSSTDHEKKKSKYTKRSRSKKTDHKPKRHETSDSSRSPSPERRKRKKKKSRRSDSNSETDTGKKQKKSKKKRRRSESESSERSSASPVRTRKKSPVKHRKRSRSRTPDRRRSRSPTKRRKRSRTRSRSPKKLRRRSPVRNRSESPGEQAKKTKKLKISEVEKKVKATEMEKKVKASEVEKKVKASEVERKVKSHEMGNKGGSSEVEGKIKSFEVEKKVKSPEVEKIVKSYEVENAAVTSVVERKVKTGVEAEKSGKAMDILTKAFEVKKPVNVDGSQRKNQKSHMAEKAEETFEVRVKTSQVESKKNGVEELAVEEKHEDEMKRVNEKSVGSSWSDQQKKKIVDVVKVEVTKKKVEKNDNQKTKEKNEKMKEKEKQKEKQKERERSKREEEKNRRDSKSRKEENKEERNRIKKSPDGKKEISDIEEEMRKRKERIEAWRNARAKKEEPKPETEKTEKAVDVNAQKKWSLEDDEDSDEETKNLGDNSKNLGDNSKSSKASSKTDEDKKKEEEEDDDDVDPLEAFMKTIDKEINKNTVNEKSSTKPKTTKTKTITVVKTVVKKTTEIKIKPELIEQNQDLMEYSSEEEGPGEVKASDFAEVKKKKELVMADHSKIYYGAFRRDFYVEVPELARMTPDQVKLYRETLGDIQVRGKNVPKPIKSWAQAGLNAKVMNVLKKCGYEKPTPIQAQAIPSVMSGRDMIGIAKTGSGKTLAFVLPMLRHVLDQPELDENDGPIAVIMTPTRELAIQIYRESKKFCKPLKLSVVCIYGGSGISEQIAELKRGAEIIVCTPGRMIDMLAANSGKVTNCRRCTYLVLDEADRMFDMGFEPQVMRIIDNIRPDRQTVLFSATFPRQMEAVARKVLNKPIEVQVGGRSVVCSDIQQNAIVIEADNKFFKLLELLGGFQEKGSVLVFVEKQETADSLFKDLLKKGYPCLSLHGGMDQFDRDSTIADFKNGVTKLMVSTSVAARGLDVKNLILVVNYDCPNHYEDYVHRVGRTGRAGNKGTAFTFVTPEQGRNVGDVVRAFELSKCQPPADILALWNDYKENMEKEGKKVKLNSGFTGKGFKFNDEEDAQVNDAKKMRKFTLGLQDSDDEAEAAENAMDKIEADLEKAFSNKPKVALAPEVVEAQKAKAAETNVDKDKIKQAGDIAALINKKLSSGQVIDRNAAATAHIMQGGALDTLKGVGLAKHVIDKLNAKLNYKAVAVESTEPEKTAAVRYEEEIDINDFPQQARWRITSKEIIEQVRELSEAGVTVRGLYIPPNRKPSEDEKRLHLYIESLSERSIQIAKAEIRRLLKEELIRAESHTYRPSQSGRYKVV